MKKVSTLFVAASLGLAPNFLLGEGLKNKPYSVSIIQIVEHPSLDAVREGAMEAIEKSDLKDKVSYDYMNAQGSMVTTAQIAKKIMGKRPSAILAIGTPAAQASINKNTQIPVVFSPITDPVGAKLVKSLEQPGGIATGTSDRSPVKQQLELILKIIPNAKKIAIMYNPGESNSISLVKAFKEACKELKLKAEEGVVQNTAMVYGSASSLKSKGVDAIYIPTDNTLVSAIESVIKAGIATKTPVFSAESESVAKGALATLSVNYRRLGETSGQMLVQILEKKSQTATMPVQTQDNFELHINQKNAEKMGVTFPAEIVKTAIKH